MSPFPVGPGGGTVGPGGDTVGPGDDTTPVSLEDPTTLTTADTFVALRARDLSSGTPGSRTTYLACEARKTMNDDPGGSYGARKRPDILDPGTISRMASDPWTGQPRPTTHTILVNDVTKFWSGLRTLHGGNFNDAEFWMYVVSDAVRRAGGDRRLIHHGFIANNPLTDSLGMQLVATDILGYTKALFRRPVPQLPQRTIRGSNTGAGSVAFPNFIDKDLRNPRAVPFALGPCIAKLPLLYGAVPAICLNEFTMADGSPGSSWVLGLLVGHDAKDGILKLFQPKDKDDVGAIADNDPDVKWPGQITAGWASINPSGAALYTDISNERFLLFAVKADSERAKAFQDGSRPIYANFKGPTDTADGTGTEMTDAHVIKPWALKNFLMRTPGYLIGSYYTTFPNFDYFPGGSVIASGVQASFDVNAKRGIMADPKFSEQLMKEWFTDNLHLSYAFEGRDSRFVGDVQLPGNSEQFLEHGSIVKEFTAPYIIDEASATIVCQAMLDLYSVQIPSLSKWPRTWAGLEDDIGDGRSITHRSGNGGSGYVDQAHWILGHDDAIAAGRVIHTGLYVEPALS